MSYFSTVGRECKWGFTKQEAKIWRLRDILELSVLVFQTKYIHHINGQFPLQDPFGLKSE